MSQANFNIRMEEELKSQYLETIEAFNEVEDMIKNWTGKTFHLVEELFEDLNSWFILTTKNSHRLK